VVSAPENIRNIPSAATVGGGPYADRFATFQVQDGEKPPYREWQQQGESLAAFVHRVTEEVNNSGGYVYCTGIWTCTVEKDEVAEKMLGLL
jgi:hypothetical protein